MARSSTRTGLWVEEAILTNAALSAPQRLILAEIACLSKTPRGCFASNAHLGGVAGIKERQLRNHLVALERLKLIRIENSNSKRRRIFCESEGQPQPTAKATQPIKAIIRASSTKSRAATTEQQSIKTPPPRGLGGSPENVAHFVNGRWKEQWEIDMDAAIDRDQELERLAKEERQRLGILDDPIDPDDFVQW